MSHGETHAKQTVMNQVDSLKGKLSNGHAADPATHGAALLLLIQMIGPIFEARLVTEEECREKMKLCCKSNRKGIGWPTAAAVLGSSGMLVGVILKLWGS